MLVFNEATEAARAAQRFFYRNEEELPQHIQDKVGPLIGPGHSPVDQIVAFTEAVYAAVKADAESVDQEGVEIAAGAADLIQRQGYHQRLALSSTPEEPRALGISNALRRIAGEAGDWSEGGDDPAVNPSYQAAPE